MIGGCDFAASVALDCYLRFLWSDKQPPSAAGRTIWDAPKTVV